MPLPPKYFEFVDNYLKACREYHIALDRYGQHGPIVGSALDDAWERKDASYKELKRIAQEKS